MSKYKEEKLREDQIGKINDEKTQKKMCYSWSSQ